MKSILKIIKATFIGGILFLAPLILLMAIFEKGNHIIQKITLPIVSNLPRVKILGLALQELTGILIIVLFCFIGGLLARTANAKKLIQKLENGILSFVPGYAFIKKTNENNFAVFIPGAPSPWSGSICFVEKKDIKEVGISQKETLACIRKLGLGSAALLKDKL